MQDHIVQGMQEAEHRHDPASMVARYHEGRDKVVPYTPPQNQTPQPSIDTGAFTPAQIRTIKGIGIVGSMATFWASFLAVAQSGALNAVFQYGAGGVFLAIVLSELKGSGRKPAQSEGHGGQQYTQFTQYNQYNNQYNGTHNHHHNGN